MKLPTVTMLAASVFLAESVLACGGSGGSFAGKTGAGRGFPIASQGMPFFSPNLAGASLNMAKQAAVAQANAYNARMAPIRIANATRVREQKVARRNARKVIMLAKLEAKKQTQREQLEFLAKARSWTDSTGDHTIDAILLDANAWGVKLLKQDGSHVNVPMNRLSSPDQHWVHTNALPRHEENRVMLAGL